MLDLFSGIGGFSLAAHWAGIETAAFCEKDKYCQEVLRMHWPDVPIVDDIMKMRGDEFGAIDIISGGFPCQPFSLAGKRKGAGDDRHLWPEMRRLIKAARPAWVLGENVAGIINVALDDVLSDLEGIGYAAQALVIPACAVDAPHRRDRVWIMAHASLGRFRRGMPSGKPRQPACRGKDVADPERIGWDGRSYDQAGRVLPGRHAPAGRGEAGAGWLPEPGMGRVANGVPKRMDRLKSLGNAIVPQVAFKIFMAIKEASK
jgi:DNA (cytosine-5)-methyltransferase 1